MEYTVDLSVYLLLIKEPLFIKTQTVHMHRPGFTVVDSQHSLIIQHTDNNTASNQDLLPQHGDMHLRT